MQHEHGGEWKLIDVESINVFKYCKPSVIKCISGIDMHGDRISKIDQCEATAVCLVYFENQNRDHVVSCCEDKDNREEW